MTGERDAFERRLEAAVRGYVEAAPTEIDAVRLAHSLATDVPRARRLVALPGWRLPSLGFAWILVVAALVTMLGMGLFVAGALRDVHLLPVSPTPGPTHGTLPAVVASPVATTPAPSAPASPSPSPSPSPTPSPTPSSLPAATAGAPQPTPVVSSPIGVVIPSSWAHDQPRVRDALTAAGYGAQILLSSDTATEK